MSAAEMLENARSLIRQRKVADGLQAYRHLTARYPNYAEGWFAFSGTESGLGHALHAIQAAKQALALATGNTLYRAHLAQLQVAYGLWGDALQTLGPLLSRAPDSFEPRIANSIGATLSLAGLEEESQPWTESAAARAPQLRDYQYNQAQGLVHCGRIKESSQKFESLLKAFPDFGKAHWSLASIDAKNADEARVTTLRKSLTRATNPKDEIFYCFALFITLDAMGRTREAFTELEHGMKLQRALTRYNGEDVATIQRLREAALSLPSTSSIPAAPAGQARPLFIVGLPRSGTTVVERILCNHPDVAQGGEFSCFSAALREKFSIESLGVVPLELAKALVADVPLQDVGERYLQLTAYKHRGYACFTDKLPFNFLLVPWIAQALPDARILHVKRDPMDTCFSNLKQLFSHHYAACYSQRDMAEYYLAYHELMQTWDRLLPERIMQVRYEDLVADPEGVSAQMFDFCGLTNRSDAWRIEQNTKPVATASAAQVRDPIDARGIGAWRRYESELDVLSNFFRSHPQLAN
jgi:tetratricopeptide (TPR) repeat protein